MVINRYNQPIYFKFNLKKLGPRELEEQKNIVKVWAPKSYIKYVVQISTNSPFKLHTWHTVFPFACDVVANRKTENVAFALVLSF